MPTAGGAADKLGNRYESRGIEFTLTTTDGATEYWSVKCQTARASGWTLNLLAESNEQGRSILGDLFGHLERSESNRAVFASAVGAPVLDELHSHAITKEMFSGRLSQSKDKKTDLTRYLLPICDNDFERKASSDFQRQCDYQNRRLRTGWTVQRSQWSLDISLQWCGILPSAKSTCTMSEESIKAG